MAASAIVVAILAAAWLAFHPKAKPPPLTISYWYWQTPFALRPTDISELRTMGVRRIFVRAGTITFDSSGSLHLRFSQEYSGPTPGISECLVFNFDYGIVRRFETIDNALIARSLADNIQRERALAGRAGLHIDGVQLDFDCPTRLLPKYADLLKMLVPRIHQEKLDFSITALPTWYTSAKVRDVAHVVDFMAPQFYESAIPRSLDHFCTISNLPLMQRGVQAAGRLGQPFYVGIPAYGHALVYGATGKLIGVYHDLGVDDALRAPYLHYSSGCGADSDGRPAHGKAYTGEDLVELTTDAPVTEDHDSPEASEDLPEVGPFRLVYDLPTANEISQAISALRADRPANCRGVILFRYPEPGDADTVPLESVAAVLRGETPHPSLSLSASVASDPWQVIEAAGDEDERVSRHVELWLKNTGTSGGFPGPDTLTVTLHFNRAGLEEVASGSFDRIGTFYQASDAPALRGSAERANMLVLQGQSPGPEGTAEIGPVTLPAGGPTRVWGDWTMTLPDGTTKARGVIPQIGLDNHE